MEGGESVAGFAPQTTISSLFSMSGANCGPLTPKVGTGASTPKETTQREPTPAVLGEPSGSNSFEETPSRALLNSSIDCSKAPRPEWLTSACAP